MSWPETEVYAHDRCTHPEWSCCTAAENILCLLYSQAFLMNVMLTLKALLTTKQASYTFTSVFYIEIFCDYLKYRMHLYNIYLLHLLLHDDLKHLDPNGFMSEKNIFQASVTMLWDINDIFKSGKYLILYCTRYTLHFSNY